MSVLLDFQPHINEVMDVGQDHLEWEIIFGKKTTKPYSHYFPINITQFKRLVNALKTNTSLQSQSKEEGLDIGFTQKDLRSYRVSFKGRSNIIGFCKGQNMILSKALITFKEKVNNGSIDNEEYCLRSNLKKEVDYHFKNRPTNLKTILGNDFQKLYTIPKTFRYKERYSFKTNNGFRYDLTLVKANYSGSNSFKESDVLNKPVDYEVEMEYLGFTRGIQIVYTIDKYHPETSTITQEVFRVAISKILSVSTDSIEFIQEPSGDTLTLICNIYNYNKKDYERVKMKLENPQDKFNNTLESQIILNELNFQTLEYDEEASIFKDDKKAMFSRLIFVLPRPSQHTLLPDMVGIVRNRMMKTLSTIFKRDLNDFTILVEIYEEEYKFIIDTRKVILTNEALDIWKKWQDKDVDVIRQALDTINLSLGTLPLSHLDIKFGSSKEIEKETLARVIKENTNLNIRYILGLQQNTPANLPVFSNQDSLDIVNNYTELFTRHYLEKKRNLEHIIDHIVHNKQSLSLEDNPLWMFQHETDAFFQSQYGEQDEQWHTEHNIPINLYKKVLLDKSTFPRDPKRQLVGKFVGPKPITLERQACQSNGKPSVLHNYTATDKADGLANLLYIDGLGKLYLIDTNLRVVDLGLSKPKLANSLLNGELITELFNGVETIGKTYRFLAYDIYIYQDKDVSNRLLAYWDTPEDDSYLTKYPTRLSLMRQVVKEVDDPMIDMKTFYPPSPTIFKSSQACWNTRPGAKSESGISNNYKYDGLIFTPSFLPVMYDYQNPFYTLFSAKRWDFNMKWKPENENSIDFYVEYEREEVGIQSKRDKVFHFYDVDEGGSIQNIRYKTLKLYNGKNIPIRQDNTCLQLYKSRVPMKYSKALFSPNQPYFEGVDCANIPLNDTGKALTEDGQVIQNGSIVEFYFDKDDTNPKFRWKAMRVRNDKTDSLQKSIRDKKTIWNTLSRICKSRQSRDLPKLENSPWSQLVYPERERRHMKDSDRLLYHLRQYLINQRTEDERYLKQHFTSVFPSWDDIPIHIEYGNFFTTANNVWKNTFQPVSQSMITTGKGLEDTGDDTIYYNNRSFRPRHDSLTIHLQKFHNFIKKSVLLDFYGKYLNKGNYPISLLDLACGKGGDLYKWKQARMSLVVGIDVVYDNIYNSQDGACRRYGLSLEESGQTNNLMDRGFNTHKNPRVFFFHADSSKKIDEQLGKSNQIYKQLWKGTSQAENQTFTPQLEKNKFNIISVQFALHYFFETPNTLDNFIYNIDNNIRKGGIFIGCCYDGSRVLDAFNRDKTSTLEGNVDNETIWKIQKMYSTSAFEETSKDLGQKINVFMYSINADHIEYLVNFDYLTQKLNEKGIHPLSPEDIQDDVLLSKKYNHKNGTISFSDIYELIETNNTANNKSFLKSNSFKYIKPIIERMTPAEKKVSFFNSVFIYRKK